MRVINDDVVRLMASHDCHKPKEMIKISITHIPQQKHDDHLVFVVAL